MSIKYILDISGNIKKQNDDSAEYEDFSSDSSDNNIYSISSELAKSELLSDGKNINLVSDDFYFADADSDDFKNLVVNESPSDPSFGTGSETKDSFKPMYHFSNENGAYFAKEFEMLTGYTGLIVGEGIDEDTFAFIFDYFAEIILLIGIMEGLALINSAIASFSSNNTSTVEKFHLTIGKHSIVEYDIVSTYLFSILNYPKADSSFGTRMVSFFVGFASWFSADDGVFLEKILESASRNSTGSKNLENFYDLNPLKNENFFLGLTHIANIAIATVEIIASILLQKSSTKRLALLIKKFRQERAWKNNLFKAKKNEDSSFLVQFDYYYVRFAIERINVGLKIVNRYAHGKTYLNPSHKEGPLTRVSGHRTKDKALSSFGDSGWEYSNSDSEGYKPGMTTRLRAIPQLLNLSYNFLNHLVYSTTQGQNINLDKSIEQNFIDSKVKEQRRIPKEIVKEIEDNLESEYVPFYLHDLRTNEVLSFHAFIESISDAFTPEYTSASGFGRIDDVRSYVKTTRNINLSFTVAATSETDHDFMWYQINKLVTMVYPQWSEGLSTTDTDTKTKFTFPFTQVPTASPLIRIRLGDVLKNNYSRSSLSRMFGLERSLPKYNNTWSNTESTTRYELLPGLYKVKTGLGDGTQRQYLEIKNPVEIEGVSNSFAALIFGDGDKKVEIDDANEVVKIKADQPNGDTELIVDSSRVRKLDWCETGVKASVGIGQNFYDIMKPFDSKGNNISNNPITNAYESGMSRGIAGFITQLDVNYNESNWETSRIGSKAPMLVKITLNFAPIHDIPPGIDHDGMMRAPVYNVGRVNNQFFGDPHDDEKGIGSGIKKAITKYSEIKKSIEG